MLRMWCDKVIGVALLWQQMGLSVCCRIRSFEGVRFNVTMRGVERDCREALYPGCIGVTEEALDKMSFWQKIKIVGRHSLQKIFAYLMVLSLLLIFARVWC